MLPLERQNQILEILNKRKAVTVEDLCQELYSSGSTIRRDLKLLEKNGFLARTHGGAVLLETSTHEAPLMLRQNENITGKKAIAAKAIKLIRDGQTIFLDSSSTCCVLAEQLSGFNNLRVVTNSLRTVNILAEHEGVSAYCTGGRLRRRALSFVGPSAVEFISSFHADFAFLSCSGVDISAGITESSEDETAVKEAYIAGADKTVVLFDRSKLGRRYFCKISELSKTSHLISDEEIPEEYLDFIKK